VRRHLIRFAFCKTLPMLEDAAQRLASIRQSAPEPADGRRAYCTVQSSALVADPEPATPATLIAPSPSITTPRPRLQ